MTPRTRHCEQHTSNNKTKKQGEPTMTDRLKGKRAFVTAGAVGIGRA
jgi:hypothetical protein